MNWEALESRLNSAVISTFSENVTLHLAPGDHVTGGVYSELVDDGATEGYDTLLTAYRLELLPIDDDLLAVGDELTVRGQRFVKVKSTPDSGLMRVELRKL